MRPEKLAIPMGAVLLFFFAIPGRGEVMVGKSLEWLVDASDAIGRYRMTSGTAPERWTGGFRIRVEGERLEPMKGPAPETVSFQYSARGTEKAPPVEPPPGAEFLVFFRKPKDAPLDAAPQVHYCICLTAPAAMGSESVAYGADFRVLRTGEDILKAVQDRIRLGLRVEGEPTSPWNPEDPYRASSPEHGAVEIEIPYGKEAFGALWSGSSCYLVAPVDEGFKRRLLRDLESKEENLETRARAARLLVNFPGRETEDRLRALLSNDETIRVTVVPAGGKEISGTVHPVRRAAYEALKRLGVAIEEPAGIGKEFPEDALY